MNEIPPIPESISHKKLHKLLLAANKEFKKPEETKLPFTETKNNFNELIKNWSEQSQTLIKFLTLQIFIILKTFLKINTPD